MQAEDALKCCGQSLMVHSGGSVEDQNADRNAADGHSLMRLQRERTVGNCAKGHRPYMRMEESGYSLAML